MNNLYFSCDAECLAQFLTALFACFGFLITIYQLRKGNREKSIANIIALKGEMSKYDEINSKLLPNGEWTDLAPDYFTGNDYNVIDFAKLVSYLGLFEVAQEMIEAGTLKKSQFRNFFEYRLVNIFSNEAVKNSINLEQDSWKKLSELYKSLQNQ